MFQLLVHGVKAHWASKSAAPSGSWRVSGKAGGPDSDGVSTRSSPSKASPMRRTRAWTPEIAPARSTPLWERPCSRSQRVSGSSCSSCSGGIGMLAAPTVHSGMKLRHCSGVNGAGIGTVRWPRPSSSFVARSTARSAAGCTSTSAASGVVSTPMRSPSGTGASQAASAPPGTAGAVRKSPGRGPAMRSRPAAASRTVVASIPSATSPMPSLP